MSYIDNNLLKGEKVLYRAHLHWVVFVMPALLFLIAIGLMLQHDLLRLLGYLFFLLAIFQWLSAVTSYLTSEYGVTNQRVIVKVGFIRRHSLETLLQRIAGISVEQTLLGRLLAYGTITIQGTGGANDRFTMISEPLVFRRRVQEQIEKALPGQQV